MKLIIFGSLISAVLATPNIKTVDSPVPSYSDVQYNCVFENLWTKDRHPRRYPSGSGIHWTRQILASHSSTYNMWREGSLASNGVRKMAEAGGTADIVKELESLNSSYEIGYAKYMVIDPTMRFNNPVAMTSEHHHLSVITKIAPSPDWFSGFHDFDALNEYTQTWYKEFTIETFPYDAGTENGDSYNIDNSATFPMQPISQFTVDNVPNGIFLNRKRNDILPVAKYTCTLNTYSSSEMGIETINSNIPSSQDVQYDCIFRNQWSRNRHPHQFPEDALAAHWTKQILASHDVTYSMWMEGSVASKGVETLAEAGGIADILKDLQEHGDSYDIGYDKYLYAKDPTVSFEPLEMTSNKRYLSAISKLAPSPDWFSGFHDFSAVDENRNTWYEKFIIPVYPYDAGTEDGDTYNTFNLPSKPLRPVSQFTVDNVPDNGIFLNQEKNEILPVGTYTCTLPASSSYRGALRTDNTGGAFRLGFGLTIGFTAFILIVGVLAYIFLGRKRKISKSDYPHKTSSSDDSNEVEESEKANIGRLEFA